jgi:hypothetical protein
MILLYDFYSGRIWNFGVFGDFDAEEINWSVGIRDQKPIRHIRFLAIFEHEKFGAFGHVHLSASHGLC